MFHLFTTARSRSLAALAALGLTAAAPLSAHAAPQPSEKPGANPSEKPSDKPSEEDIARAKEAFAKGKALFDNKDYKGAVAQFKESYRLSQNPLLLYNIGYTLDQLGDKSMALFYYRKYLEDAPKTDGNRANAEARIQALEREIEQETLLGGSGAGAQTGTGTSEPGSPDKPAQPAAPVDRFQHIVIDEAPPGKPIDVSAFVPPGSDWVVTLFYRAPGEAKFTAVRMTPRYNELVGRIPASATTSASVQYYIEVRDKAGKIVDRSGRSTSPHLVFLDPKAKARYYADLGDETAEPISESEAVAAGGGFSPTPEPSGAEGGGGWMDAGSSRFTKLKWGVTGGALGLVALSGTLYLLSSKAGSDLEAEAEASTDPAQCGNTMPPCRSFSDKQQGLEGRGQRFETWAHISLGIGAAAAIGAGVLWYLDLRGSNESEVSDDGPPAEPSFSAAPVIGEGFVGGAAAVRF